jgi:hypothetical protein
MGDNKQKQTTQTTGSTPRASSQVGTHGQTGSTQGEQGKDWSQGQGSQNKGQGQYRGQGQPMNQGQDSYGSRDMEQGDRTMPAQPDGTSPLDKDQQPVNQNRGQQNR